MNDTGKSHDCQRDVGHIIEEATQEPVAYLPFDKRHGQYADEVGGYDGQQWFLHQYMFSTELLSLINAKGGF